MKVKTKIKLIMLMLVVMAAALFAGCTVGPDDLDTFREKNNLEASITYYGNGGIFNENSNMTKLVVEYPADQPAMEITSSTRVKVALTKYLLVHWVYVELDESGAPIFENEAQTQPRLTDTVVDFSTLILKSGDHLHISAVWVEDVLLEYELVSTAPVTMEVRGVDAEGNSITTEQTFNNGDVFYTETYGVSGQVTVSDIARTVSTDSTYLEYFLDRGCTQSAVGNVFTKPTDGQNDRIFARYISGVYTVVKNSSQVSSMFLLGLTSRGAYYIYNDIDCANLFTSSGVPFPLTYSNFRCTIVGNGHTISNLKFQTLAIAAGSTYSMFGSFADSANIKDLTLSNIEINASLRNGSSNIYLINGGITAGATFENFIIDNITLNITSLGSGGSITNIPGSGSVYTTTNWMFGGATSDSEFLAANSGIEVTNAKLTIEGQTIVGSDGGIQPASINITANMPNYIIRKENI